MASRDMNKLKVPAVWPLFSSDYVDSQLPLFRLWMRLYGLISSRCISGLPPKQTTGGAEKAQVSRASLPCTLSRLNTPLDAPTPTVPCQP